MRSKSAEIWQPDGLNTFGQRECSWSRVDHVQVVEPEVRERDSHRSRELRRLQARQVRRVFQVEERRLPGPFRRKLPCERRLPALTRSQDRDNRVQFTQFPDALEFVLARDRALAP